MAAFLRRVPAEYPAGPVDVVWDHPAGARGAGREGLLAQRPRLAPHCLPPYAPDPNAADGCGA